MYPRVHPDTLKMREQARLQTYKLKLTRKIEVVLVPTWIYHVPNLRDCILSFPNKCRFLIWMKGRLGNLFKYVILAFKILTGLPD